ncbi:putative spermidine/putrescine ABC transporter permease protein (plasmid) [Sinorhizobium fredii HH103]|uniref:Spermidine/putrescine ABC transporter permease protein n=1 Tax=Sinorhizobium fredii (strain HH103) TaxID=1117943 RepID=G9AI21_SINF1|nr:ABC transporter permease [Sinorhizobium fredii]CCF00703.1 putative spermidine/putrescine ABC transporter permease protein [Sinorhizobium fredii HH103]
MTNSSPHSSARSTLSSARFYSPSASLGLAAPLLAALVAGFLYPVVRLVALSFSGGTFDHYRRIFSEPLHLGVLLSTIEVALVVTIASLVVGFPVAYLMARLSHGFAVVVAACVFIPLWTSVLIRSYAWVVLLQRNGIVNQLLLEIGVTDGPLKLIYTQGAVILAMTHVLMPFMILPIYSALCALPPDYIRAARNLGAGPVRAFVAVTLPLSLPGVFAGSVMCFVLALGFYITPALVGGPGSMLMATLIGQQTAVLLDWPFAAALSTVLLAVTLLFVLLFRRSLSLSKGLNSVH